MDLYENDPTVFIEKADMLKALGHPVRLCIVAGLFKKGTCNVTTMYECLKMPQSTISQHLSKLRAYGIIEGKRHGNEICYEIKDEKVKQLIEVLLSD